MAGYAASLRRRFLSAASSASRMPFLTQLVTVRQSSTAACFIRATNSAGSRTVTTSDPCFRPSFGSRKERGASSQNRRSLPLSVSSAAAKAIVQASLGSMRNQSVRAPRQLDRTHGPRSLARRSARNAQARRRITTPCSHLKSPQLRRRSAMRIPRSAVTPILVRPFASETTYRYAKPLLAIRPRPARSSAFFSSAWLIAGWFGLPVSPFPEPLSGDALEQPGDGALLLGGFALQGVSDPGLGADADAGVPLRCAQKHNSSIDCYAPLDYAEDV